MNIVDNSSGYSFQQQTVWVTGAARGIGRVVADRFVHLGARVLGLDCRFEGRGYAFTTRHLDVSDPEQVRVLVEEMLHEGMGPRVLVNAAGVLRLGDIDKTSRNAMSLKDWEKCMDVNVSGVFYLLRELSHHFKTQRQGAIVNIASNASRVPRMCMGGYCASKAALQSLSHCAALELAEFGVRCNLVSPGSTDTEMLQSMLMDKRGNVEDGYQRTIAGIPEQYKLGIPLKKIAKPEEIANTVIFLASDQASHITMQNIVVDGGATLSA
ncbi:2,3-dihydro-2,3-dihydroxybenzoate dehydrogenase [Microbulbifer thermotolerans]|uniref:2,3-dihydro-2,3-dihydroxybenzoate dehydrogenase n=1 Tax=Microbulbifer thermotolerans TaxID=252514 RepID=UPI0008E1D210|nr:2,3-dihydro-2,3-dihydroxybenzoate dehydrogenase [Microbulbifer thermotolerans]SFD10529.1 2,3-dihydro-2,3-dihydroxybenzoate dehydrogenase [Microbulbifer thermotolerans]